ncbi:hypothetical protein DPMN_058047 [Dreissena polymorpha]|uniref:Uncharacterized protein n=1 Tax=Dreissena polymorpha TaxID=45954 RepID=A0A9D4HD04_DREPO|nr:hypothetical protein DPMN_058047 [Dreissena polymorpha]
MCERCIDSYYPSSKDCLQCNSFNCRTCDTAGVCTSCKTGFYSAICYNPCGSGSINGRCDFHAGQCQ